MQHSLQPSFELVTMFHDAHHLLQFVSCIELAYDVLESIPVGVIALSRTTTSGNRLETERKGRKRHDFSDNVSASGMKSVSSANMESLLKRRGNGGLLGGNLPVYC